MEWRGTTQTTATKVIDALLDPPYRSTSNIFVLILIFLSTSSLSFGKYLVYSMVESHSQQLGNVGLLVRYD